VSFLVNVWLLEIHRLFDECMPGGTHVMLTRLRDWYRSQKAKEVSTAT
jgi:hypothetical protein